MIDIHAHILYGLDDGPRSLDESLAMCCIAQDDGTQGIVATPHTGNGIYTNSRSTIIAMTKALNLAFCSEIEGRRFEKDDPVGAKREAEETDGRPRREAEARASKFPFQIFPGADVGFSFDLPARVERGEVLTLNDGGRFLLLEFPSQAIPFHSEEVIFQLMAKRIVPIISHPERNLEISDRPTRFYEMVRMGCLGQVTAMSLTGGFGREVRRVAERLLAKRLVHFIASDAHSPDRRPPLLSGALREAEKIVGSEVARRMVIDNPYAILEGRRPNVYTPLPP